MASDPFHDIAAHLRQRADLIDEWEVTERETEQGRLRRRSLADVWEQSMHRGDRVRAMSPSGPITGTVDFVGRDYATVFDGDRCWELPVERWVMQPHRSTRGGHTVSGGSRTFRARMAEFEATGEEVTVCVSKSEYRGRIAVAAADHLVLAGDPPTVVPLAAISAVHRLL